jgi:hypothetical protein
MPRRPQQIDARTAFCRFRLLFRPADPAAETACPDMPGFCPFFVSKLPTASHDKKREVQYF